VPEGGANCADPYAARLAVGNATRDANSASSWGEMLGWVGCNWMSGIPPMISKARRRVRSRRISGRLECFILSALRLRLQPPSIPATTC